MRSDGWWGGQRAPPDPCSFLSLSLGLNGEGEEYERRTNRRGKKEKEKKKLAGKKRKNCPFLFGRGGRRHKSGEEK